MSAVWYLAVGFILGFACGATGVLYSLARKMVPTLSLKGWFCMCGIFNGEEKEIQIMCRTCARSREWALKNQPQNLTRIAYLGDGR